MSSRKFDVPLNILDSSRFRLETGWEPKTDLTVRMRLVYEYSKRSLDAGLQH
jgi:nucleoside-diphosphate-sugar epimerase